MSRFFNSISSVGLLILLLAFLGSASSSAKSSINYTANDSLDNKTKSAIEKYAARIKTEYLNDSLNALLSSAGYLQSRIEFNNDSVLIKAGKRFSVSGVNVRAIDIDGRINDYEYKKYSALPATEQNILFIKDDIISDYYSRGHYFASLITDSIIPVGTNLKFNYRLLSGPKVYLERMRIKGLSKTKPKFVRNLSGMKEHDIFTLESVERTVENISRVGYLHIDSLPAITPNQDYNAVELLLFVSEQKSNSLELIGGYLPRRDNSSGEIVGRINFTSQNLFGGGRGIDFLIDRKDRNSSRLEFALSQPIFIPDYLELALRFQQIDNGDAYHQFLAESSVSLFSHKNTRFTGAFSWTKTEPQNLSQPPSRNMMGRFEYEYNDFLGRLNPMKGYRLLAGLSYMRRISWPYHSTVSLINNESMFKLAIDNYINLRKHLIIRLNYEAGVLITSRPLIEYSEQFKLGGYGSLRGYRQEQFSGRRVSLIQMEFRYRPSSSSALYLFSDMGYIYSRNQISDDNTASEEIYRIGYGTGLYVSKNNVRTTIEIGWGKGDSFGQGKLHFSLATMF